MKTIPAILVLMMTIGDFVGTGFASLAIPSESDLAAAGSIKLSPATQPSLSDDEITRRMNALQQLATPEQYDCDAFAKTLGPGVEPAFDFVRNHIRFESYTGELRGAYGTFDARAGNAIDRALLLARLLEDKGIHRRFVQGQLDQEHAEMLLARMFGAPVAPAQTPAEGIVFQLQQRALRDYAILRPILAKDLTCTVPSHEQLLAEVRQHTWLQAEIDGKWIDLDPSFADAQTGQAFCAVQRQFDDISDELCQQVAIRVVAQTLENGELKSKTVLDFTSPADGLLDRQIFFTQVPSKPADVAGGLAGGISSDAGDSWTPVLWMAGKTQAGSPVVFLEQPAKAQRGQPIGGGFGGMFGGGGAMAGGGSVIVAETLEFEIRFPDGRKDLTRRVLFDRAGAATRAGNSSDPAKLQPLARDDNGLNAPRQLLNIWFTAGGHNLAGYAQAAQLLARYGGRIDEKSRFGLRVWPLALRNFELPLISDQLIVPAINDRPDVRFYADSPRILIATYSSDSNGNLVFSVDLRRDHLRAVARDDSARPAVAERKLWFSVLESALEHSVGEQCVVDAGGDPALAESCSSLMDSGSITVVRSATDADALGIDLDSRQILRDRTAQGTVLLFPRQELASTAGWWEISPNGDVTSVYRGLNGFDFDGIHTKGSSGKPPQTFVHSGNTEGLPPEFEANLPMGPAEEEEPKAGGNEYEGMKEVARAEVQITGSSVPLWEDICEELANCTAEELANPPLFQDLTLDPNLEHFPN